MHFIQLSPALALPDTHHGKIAGLILHARAPVCVCVCVCVCMCVEGGEDMWWYICSLKLCISASSSDNLL